MFQKSPSKTALILRFSSFGDIVQASFAAQSLVEQGYTVDLVTKKDFAQAFNSSSFPYNQIYAYDKSSSYALWGIASKISQKNYSLIYDAHNNQRTFLLKLFLMVLKPLYFLRLQIQFKTQPKPKLITRSKYRFKRFMLFKLNIDLFPNPFKGAESYLKPLKLSLPAVSPQTNSVHNEPAEIIMAPSAAWDLKKWPIEHWIELGQKTASLNCKITFIGGPQDLFINEITKALPTATNLAGKLSWSQTIDKIKTSTLLISGDTGVLHIADYLGVNAIALMGPSAFGRPSRESSKVINKNLSCQPCSKDGRGKCKNPDFKKCLTSISPLEVFNLCKERLS